MIIRIVKLRLSLPPSVINDSVLHTFILKITNLDLVKYKLWNMIWTAWADKFAQYFFIYSFLVTLFKFLNHPYVMSFSVHERHNQNANHFRLKPQKWMMEERTHMWVVSTCENDRITSKHIRQYQVYKFILILRSCW